MTIFFVIVPPIFGMIHVRDKVPYVLVAIDRISCVLKQLPQPPAPTEIESGRMRKSRVADGFQLQVFCQGTRSTRRATRCEAGW